MHWVLCLVVRAVFLLCRAITGSLCCVLQYLTFVSRLCFAKRPPFTLIGLYFPLKCVDWLVFINKCLPDYVGRGYLRGREGRMIIKNPLLERTSNFKSLARPPAPLSQWVQLMLPKAPDNSTAERRRQKWERFRKSRIYSRRRERENTLYGSSSNWLPYYEWFTAALRGEASMEVSKDPSLIAQEDEDHRWRPFETIVCKLLQKLVLLCTAHQKVKNEKLSTEYKINSPTKINLFALRL